MFSLVSAIRSFLPYVSNRQITALQSDVTVPSFLCLRNLARAQCGRLMRMLQITLLIVQQTQGCPSMFAIRVTRSLKWAQETDYGTQIERMKNLGLRLDLEPFGHLGNASSDRIIVSGWYTVYMGTYNISPLLGSGHSRDRSPVDGFCVCAYLSHDH